MGSIATLLFLLCFTVIPLAMVVTAGLFFVRWVRERRARAELREAGWEPIAEHDSALRKRLSELMLPDARWRLTDRARLANDGDPLFFVVLQEPSRADDKPHFAYTLLIARRLAPTPVGSAPLGPAPIGSAPIGVVQRRGGNLFEKPLVALGRALGFETIDAPGWEWAIVGGPTPAPGWPAEVGAALAQTLREGEHLRLGASHIALGIPRHAPPSRLMREAQTRIAELRAALGEGGQEGVEPRRIGVQRAES